MAKSAMLDRARDSAAAAKGAMGWWDRSRTFLSEVQNELKRVTWPSRKEVYATTLVVILTSVMFGVYLWGIDLVLNAITGSLFRAFGAS